MPAFSKRSAHELSTCDEQLQKLFYEIIKHVDCTIIQGHRGETEQNEYFRTGKSKLKFPNSKHNTNPSIAVDVAPYVKGIGIPWKNHQYFYHFGGYVRAVADQMGIRIRWGGDWDSDNNLLDQTFFDLVHFELKK